MFCLQDGARLSSASGSDVNATLQLPSPARPTEPGPTVFNPPSAPSQPTITATPEQLHRPARPTAPEYADVHPRRSSLPWLLAIVFVMGVFGVVIALIVTLGGASNVARNQTPTPQPTIDVPRSTPELRGTPTSTPDRYATPTPEATKPKPMFTVMDNTSFDGTRITYYPRPSFGQCQADCARNPSCHGFTWIRPGAYNPSDPGMCYLMATMTTHTSHPCCISAVRN